MVVVINISEHRVAIVKNMAQELLGRVPSDEEIQGFFNADVDAVYGDHWKSCLDEAIEAYFFTEE